MSQNTANQIQAGAHGAQQSAAAEQGAGLTLEELNRVCSRDEAVPEETQVIGAKVEVVGQCRIDRPVPAGGGV